MLKRTISGAVLTVLTAAALIEGRYLLIICLLFASLGALREFYQVIGSKNKNLDNKRFDCMAVWGYISCVIYLTEVFFGMRGENLLMCLLVVLLVMMLIYVVQYPRYEPLDLFAGFFGVIYVPVMMSAIYTLRQRGDGIYSVWFIFVGSWVCDTCAYFVGSFFGKHKLIPILSPKKTVEGAVGGVIGAVVVAVIYAFIVIRLRGHEPGTRVTVIGGFAMLAMLTSVFSMIGDLTASAFKRHYGIKDYGDLIPGHGGILDRFDSVIVTAPLVYLVMNYLVFK